MGSIAFALTPEPDGLRLHANYWRGPSKETPSLRPESAELLHLVPREAAAFALVRGFPDVVSSLVPQSGRASKGRALLPFVFWNPLGSLLREENLPEAVLVALLPREGTSHKLALAGALSGPGAAETIRRLRRLLPEAEAAEIEGIQVFATDAQGLRQFQEAAQHSSARLEIQTQPEVRLQAWARPGQLWPALDNIGDLGFTVWESAAGGQLELYLKAEPRDLLGGP